jgi:hypothetical protein
MTLRNRAAVGLLVVLLVYYEIFRWIPLGRWNWGFRWPVRNDQFYPDIVIGLLLILFMIAFARRWPWGMWLGLGLLGLWAGVHFFDWWLPYLRSLPSNGARYRFYSQHTQILPVIGDHYPPDGGHAVLDLILYPTWIACLVAALSGNRASRQSG